MMAAEISKLPFNVSQQSLASESLPQYHKRTPRASDDIPLVDLNNTNNTSSRSALSRAKGGSLLSVAAWWFPEILASILAIGFLASIVGILRHYDHHPLGDLHLPLEFTLNGLISALATLTRACIAVPIGSAIIQELWLYYAAEAERPQASSKLQDASRFDAASRGPLGSLMFLFYLPGRK
jgi:hypothetical protein